MTPARMAAIQQAVRLYRAGKIDEARAHTLKSLKTHKDSHELLEILGLSCSRKRQFKQAIAAFQQIIKLGKANRTIIVNLTKANYELGRYETAEQLLLKLRKRAPNDLALAVLLGDVAVKKGQLGLALAHYDEAASDPRFEAEIRNGKARILSSLLEPEAAVEEVRKSMAAKLRGESKPVNLLTYPTALLTDNDLARAEQQLDAGISGAKPPSAVLHDRGLIAYHRGDLPGFADTLRKANALKLKEFGKDPSERPFFEALNKQTDTLGVLGDWPKGKGAKLLLIVGPSTSGKSTLEAMLVASPHTLPRYEAFNKEAMRRFEKEWPKTPTDEEALKALFFLGKEDEPLKDKTVLCTLPAVIFRLPMLSRLIPGLHVVYIAKDTLPLTIDILTKYYTNGNAYSFDLAATQEYIADYRAYMKRFGEILGDRFLEIRQSDISDDPQGTIARVEQMLGQSLDIDAEAARPKVYPQAEGYYDTMADLLGVPRED